MNDATLEQYKNEVDISLFRIESDHAFLSASQVIDLPKERKNDYDQTR